MSALPASTTAHAIHAMGLVSLDGSLFVQMAIFFALLFALQRLLFRPTLETIRMREERTVGARAEADTLREDAEERMSRYDGALKEARAEAVAARRQLREEATEQRTAILDAVRNDTQSLLEDGRADLAAATDEAREGVTASGDALARRIVARLLGRAAIVLLVALPAGQALASGGAEGHHSYLWLKDAFFLAINLGILLWIYLRYGARSVQASLATRKAEISRELDEAARLHAQAKEMLDDYGARLEGMEAERKQLVEEFRSAGETEKTRILAEAEATAERMRQDAQNTIDVQIRRARLELEGEVLERAITRAAETLRDEVGKSEQTQLVDEFVDRLAALPRAEA